MKIDDKILENLKRNFPHANIELINESYKHAGHAGDNGTGQTHYKVEVISDVFEGLSRLASQKMVMTVLKPLMGDGGIHALSLKTKIK